MYRRPSAYLPYRRPLALSAVPTSIRLSPVLVRSICLSGSTVVALATNARITYEFDFTPGRYIAIRRQHIQHQIDYSHVRQWKNSPPHRNKEEAAHPSIKGATFTQFNNEETQTSRVRSRRGTNELLKIYSNIEQLHLEWTNAQAADTEEERVFLQ
ncbi:hypothetical protein COOONC_02272 [Cooperia oncophora]